MSLCISNTPKSIVLSFLLITTLFAESSTITIQLKKNHPQRLKEHRLTATYLGLNEKGEALLELNYSERETYKSTPHSPGHGSKKVESYSTNLRDYVDRIYRTHYYCNGKIRSDIHDGGYEIIDLDKGYSNFSGHSQFNQHCIDDGSFDTYYDEVADYGSIPFILNEAKSDAILTLTIIKASKKEATLEVITQEIPHKTRPQRQFIMPPSHDSSIQLLRDLKKLLDEGILTQEEYNTKKKEILERL